MKRCHKPESELGVYELVNRYGGIIVEDVNDFIHHRNKTYITSDGTMWDLESAWETIKFTKGNGLSVF